MPRRPKILIEVGAHHVYNRVASGETALADPDETNRIVDLILNLFEPGTLVWRKNENLGHYG